VSLSQSFSGDYKIQLSKSGERSLCCGGSIGILEIKSEQRDKIMSDTIKTLSASKPDKIVTSCPLCKKTLTNGAEIPVEDIAETVAHALISESVTV
jgi:Fe-S oxidoreductase